MGWFSNCQGLFDCQKTASDILEPRLGIDYGHAEAVVRYNQLQVNLLAAIGVLGKQILIDASHLAAAGHN